MNYDDALYRIRELADGGTTRGVHIARVLVDEGCSLSVVIDALRAHGYVAEIEELPKCVLLHLSDTPLQGKAHSSASKVAHTLPAITLNRQ